MAHHLHEARITWLFVIALILIFKCSAEPAPVPLHWASPDYFDKLRSSNNTDSDVLMSVTRGTNSSVYKVVFAEEHATVTYRLVEIKGFLRFASQGEFIPALVNEAFATVLAMHHFNNMQERGHPILGDQVTSDVALSNCDIRLTMELFDSQQSATLATQTFSSVMRRPQSLQTPPATVVVGASISSETMPLAVYTGVNFIPQVSASATSTIFDDKEQFPLFGRTTTNTNGEAAVAARFFHSIGSTHVAIIFGTDTYISAMHKGFLREATILGLVTESLVYSDPTNADETKNVIAWLKRLQFRHVLVLCYEETLDPILTTAAAQEAVGPGYLYVFPCFDVFVLQDILRVQSGSPLAQSLHGTALIQMRGSGIPDPVVQDQPSTPKYNETSTVGDDRFRVAWRDALVDSTFIEYVRSKLPVSLDGTPNFDRKANFSQLPSGFLPFLYDAVTALGISMCRAGAQTTWFTGDDIYHQFRNLDFEGASGRNEIMNETGTRLVETITFVVWNVRIANVVSNGNSLIEYVPTHSFEGGTWKEISGNAFEYADGTSIPPGSLPPVPFEYNYIGTVLRSVSYFFMSLVMICSLSSLVWTIVNRKNHVVDSAQPLFLIMTAIGVFIMASSIVPLSLDEAIVSRRRSLDAACMLTPWLYFIGTSVAFGGLLAKAKAVHKAYMDPSVEEVQVSPVDILKAGTILVGSNFLLLLTWSLVSPLEWTRVNRDQTDSFNRLVESYAVCDSDESVGFVVFIIVLNVFFLARGSLWAYRTRNLATEYNESRYVGLVIAGVLQVWLMGLPVVLALGTLPFATFFVKSGIIILTSGIIVLLVFLPKVIDLYKDRGLDAQELRQLYRSFKKFSTMQMQRFDDNDDSTDFQAPESNSHLPISESGQLCQDALNRERSVPKSSSTRRIKIIHNPRSARNLQITGGLELSREQIEKLQLSDQRGVIATDSRPASPSDSHSSERRSEKSTLFRVDESEHEEYSNSESLDASQRFAEPVTFNVARRRSI